ncbi:MAG TPA: hypothetical protein PLB31_02250 [Fimbriimonadaceae bacterium]|nr:hypothetical protein [Fimbriimonadaceae bacterium]HRE93574.1 hypothetical protein [Fimbriimonadaceae bacterium]HRI73271.1 hypothetical protein [Fimbriimonadaceae bacterium]
MKKSPFDLEGADTLLDHFRRAVEIMRRMFFPNILDEVLGRAVPGAILLVLILCANNGQDRLDDILKLPILVVAGVMAAGMLLAHGIQLLRQLLDKCLFKYDYYDRDFQDQVRMAGDLDQLVRMSLITTIRNLVGNSLGAVVIGVIYVAWNFIDNGWDWLQLTSGNQSMFYIVLTGVLGLIFLLGRLYVVCTVWEYDEAIQIVRS